MGTLANILLLQLKNEQNSNSKSKKMKKKLQLQQSIKRIFFLLFLTTSSFIFSQKTYTPPKGSSERKQIMDLFREDFGSEKNEILFKVDHLLINGNCACAYVTPLKNNQVYGEPRWDLLKKSNGSWRAVNWKDGIDFQNEFEMIDLPRKNDRIAKQIVRLHPTCSMSIFGK
jgi:hypothetical protein